MARACVGLALSVTVVALLCMQSVTAQTCTSPGCNLDVSNKMASASSTAQALASTAAAALATPFNLTGSFADATASLETESSALVPRAGQIADTVKTIAMTANSSAYQTNSTYVQLLTDLGLAHDSASTALTAATSATVLGQARADLSASVHAALETARSSQTQLRVENTVDISEVTALDTALDSALLSLQSGAQTATDRLSAATASRDCAVQTAAEFSTLAGTTRASINALNSQAVLQHTAAEQLLVPLNAADAVVTDAAAARADALAPLQSTESVDDATLTALTRSLTQHNVSLEAELAVQYSSTIPCASAAQTHATVSTAMTSVTGLLVELSSLRARTAAADVLIDAAQASAAQVLPVRDSLAVQANASHEAELSTLAAASAAEAHRAVLVADVQTVLDVADTVLAGAAATNASLTTLQASAAALSALYAGLALSTAAAASAATLISPILASLSSATLGLLVDFSTRRPGVQAQAATANTLTASNVNTDATVTTTTASLNTTVAAATASTAAVAQALGSLPANAAACVSAAAVHTALLAADQSRVVAYSAAIVSNAALLATQQARLAAVTANLATIENLLPSFACLPAGLGGGEASGSGSGNDL